MSAGIPPLHIVAQLIGLLKRTDPKPGSRAPGFQTVLSRRRLRRGNALGRRRPGAVPCLRRRSVTTGDVSQGMLRRGCYLPGDCMHSAG